MPLALATFPAQGLCRTGEGKTCVQLHYSSGRGKTKVGRPSGIFSNRLAPVCCTSYLALACTRRREWSTLRVTIAAGIPIHCEGDASDAAARCKAQLRLTQRAGEAMTKDTGPPKVRRGAPTSLWSPDGDGRRAQSPADKVVPQTATYVPAAARSRCSRLLGESYGIPGVGHFKLATKPA